MSLTKSSELGGAQSPKTVLEKISINQLKEGVGQKKKFQKLSLQLPQQ